MVSITNLQPCSVLLISREPLLYSVKDVINLFWDLCIECFNCNPVSASYHLPNGLQGGLKEYLSLSHWTSLIQH